MYLKDSPPTTRSPGSLLRYLDGELSKIREYFEVIRDAVAQLAAYRIIGGISAPYLWDDTGTTMIDPGAGYIRGNSANLNTLTAFTVSKTDALGRPLEGQGDDELIGQNVYLQSRVGNVYVLGQVAAVTDNGTWVQYDLAPTPTGAGNPAQDDLFEFVWYPSQSVADLQTTSLGATGLRIVRNIS